MNVKKELLTIMAKFGKTIKDIKGINITLKRDSWDSDMWCYLYYRSILKASILDANFNQLESKLNLLDFNYDNGYGSQQLFGCVVFTDGSWLERHTYDGSEWWEYKKEPNLDDLMNWNFNEDSMTPTQGICSK